jgi:aldose 1-epimerase
VSGADHATVVEVGGGLRSYVADGRELLDGYAEDEMAEAARGQVLIPWPNRLGDGRYVWDGETHQVALTEPGHGNAIHGLVCTVAWECAGHSTSRVDLHHVVHPQPGYPFTLDLVVSYELGDGGLTVTTTATNLGDVALPYAAGHHPYLAAGGLLDACTLEAPGATELTVDERFLPTGRRPAADVGHDFRRPRTIGEVVLDTTFTDLERDDEGRAWVRLTRPDGSRAALWLDDAHPYVQLYTGDSLGDRARQGLAVEPMTAPPDAFRSGADLTRLRPGESTTATWGVRPLP